MAGVRKVIKSVVSHLIDSKPGKRLANLYLLRHKDFAVSFLQKHNKKAIKDINIDELNRPRGFEDLSWLFSSSKANRGIIRIDLSEAAYLFSLARSIPAAKILEIGRYEGGSTILFAAATDENAMLTSVDISPKSDNILMRLLTKFNLDKKVELIIDDANNLNSKSKHYDIIFIDGDHSYEGVHKDYEHWKDAVKIGGHLLFHDCYRFSPGVFNIYEEIKKRDQHLFKEHKKVASLVDFLRIN